MLRERGGDSPSPSFLPMYGAGFHRAKNGNNLTPANWLYIHPPLPQHPCDMICIQDSNVRSTGQKLKAFYGRSRKISRTSQRLDTQINYLSRRIQASMLYEKAESKNAKSREANATQARIRHEQRLEARRAKAQAKLSHPQYQL